MADLGHLSDAQILAKANGNSLPATSTHPNLDHLSNEEIMNRLPPPPEPEKSFSDKVKEKAINMGNATVDALPAIGAAVGGVFGGVGGLGVGAIPAAAAGGVAGVGLRNTIRGFQSQGPSFATNPPTVSGAVDQLQDAGRGAIQGASQEMGGQLLGKAAQHITDTGSGVINSPGLGEAAQRLRITPTIGMNSNNPVTRGIESSLEQSPTIAGASMRSKTTPVKTALSDATENLLKDASQNTNYETGSIAINGISQKLGEKYNNVQMAYENFNQELPKMVPDDVSKFQLADQVAGHGKGNLSLTSDMEGYANKVANKVMDSKNLSDIESIRKQVGNSLNQAYQAGDHNAIDALSGIQDRLSDFRDNQFISLAQRNYPGQGGANMGNQMVQEYQATRQQYAEMMNDLKEVGPVFGIKNKNPKAFIEAVQNIPPEQMSKKLFTPNNLDKLNVVNQYFPEEFQQVKNLKLSEIANSSKSVVNGEEIIDPNKFLKQVNKLQPEVQSVLFGDNVQTIKDIKRVAQSLPRKIGPSGTPEGIGFMESFNPLHEVPNQIGGLGKLGFYNLRGSPTVHNIIESKVPQIFGNTSIGLGYTRQDQGPSTTIKPTYKLKGK